MTKRQTQPINKIFTPIQRFIAQQRSGGIVLAISVVIALIIANSPLAESYFKILDYKFGFIFNGAKFFEYSVQTWINDGLMAMFFFVVGLELKREFIAGELSKPRQAILPIAAATGGMLVPALIYIAFNPAGEAMRGWGIPVATDIALALGILYLLGDRVPMSLKVFLTALAITDDIGAVLVVALFYTSDISLMSLAIGLGFVLVMFLANKMGVRSILFYAIVGILGVWTAFLLSGVHATIAAILAAFMIPANVAIKEDLYINRILRSIGKFKRVDFNDNIPTLLPEQLHILEDVKVYTNLAIPPLQRLEHAMQPFVSFVVLPIFALANAGVSFSNINLGELFSTNIIWGVSLGLFVGKIVGIVGATMLLIKLKVSKFPAGMNFKNLVGVGIICSIGFTMSIFITSLAFTNELYLVQAKVGILVTSILGGVLGYFYLKAVSKNQTLRS